MDRVPGGPPPGGMAPGAAGRLRPIVFTGSGGSLSDTTYTRDCANPVIEVTFTCGATVTATIRNTGGAMYLPQSVSIMQGTTSMPLNAST
ncbi:MAG: hypothetical protein IH616_22630, partial [Gemmatimonadales bacterium]|nr:hypothetical protein [Gemmatimonadales bacterium]